MLDSEIKTVEKEGTDITDSLSPQEQYPLFEHIFPFWKIESAKNGMKTIRENGMLLHSAYDPRREAETVSRQIKQADGENSITGAVFCGFGAGYLPCVYAAQHPGHTLLLIEPDARHFLAALALLDWTLFFQCRDCITAVACNTDDVIALIEKTGIQHCTFFLQKNQTRHAQNYFDTITALIERNRQKADINNNTLERFSGLWLRNSCRNLCHFAELDGVALYENKAGGLPAVILAAGPTLEDALPYLAELKKRALIICVDTALRACLRAGVEPDFIILVDPQYWAAKHIIGLTSPSSVLITESAAYPPVYRFPCRKTVLCSSLFPLGNYFEQRLGIKGKLDAGGSVATTAWDFARFTGAAEIYMAGLDLGYPLKKTHIPGSTFEETAFTVSERTASAETASVRTLFSAAPEYSKDYSGSSILTDKRMKLFAWWFESRIARSDAPATYSFSFHSLSIPGIRPYAIHDFLQKPEAAQLRSGFFRNSEHACPDAELQVQKAENIEKFRYVHSQLQDSFNELYQTAKKGYYLCTRALSVPGSEYASVFKQLDEIDHTIMTSSSKDAASLVFPTEKQLDTILSEENIPAEPHKASIFHSLVIYRELLRAIKKYTENPFFSSKLFPGSSDTNSMLNDSAVDGL